MSLRDSLRAAGEPWSTDVIDAGPVSSYEPWLWLMVVGALVLDVATTTYGLERGLSEANPIANRLFTYFDPLSAMLVLKGVVIAVGIVVWYVLPYRYRGFVPLGVALPWTVAGVFNLTVLARFVL